LKKLLITKTCKRKRIAKKIGLKSYREKLNEDEIKKKISQTKKITIKRTKTKLERLKNYRG
jgi:hypothetical protein